MIRGFGLLEMLIALSLGMAVMSVIIAHAGESGRMERKISGNQQRLEAIFHAVDAIKSDLNKCGMRLQEARPFSGLAPFAASPGAFSCTYGLADEPLLEGALRGQQSLRVAAGECFRKARAVLLFDPANGAWELNEVQYRLDGVLVMKRPLQSDFPLRSAVVALKRVEYRYDPAQRVLKRRSDNGTFQPLLEQVSDFYVTFFPDANSVLYRIEIGRKEQVRGYVFLLNAV